MSDEMKPALTPSEWSHWPGHRGLEDMALEAAGSLISHLDAPVARRRHALAALCLYQQPFGFTQEDVCKLRSLASVLPYGPVGDPHSGPLVHGAVETLKTVASRIAALLPPSDSEGQ